MPVVLTVMLSIASPNYLPILLKVPIGHKLIYVAVALAIGGIWWIRRIIRIEV